ncbi:PadR family transcriptional regulator [Aquihabitans sp. G128]|uniref:PadR family transcriptional regulator n=1 Tax=Aquihabitans sp. G128 TaxID=2849779 RepID=UPI001C222682|nr:PadR family transcriptional regulator [Aquihabitans sp. G128]QXC63352.1 PadR family transcriptional regulator [Aquihabitans sp. G128]
MFDERSNRGPWASAEGGRRRAAYDETVAEGGFPADRFGGRGPRGRGGRFGGGPRGGPFGGGMGGFGGGGFGGPRGRGRARRGDVRLAILALLAERPMHGYEMIQELGERTNGAWTPSPGSVYPTLTLLEEEGLVTSEEVEGKRRFDLTDEGQAAVDSREGPPPWEQAGLGAEPVVLELREVLGSTMAAVKQVFQAGSTAQQAKAVEILTEARRKIYEVLAAEA